MNVYTKKGDGGQTSLYGGKRVAKDDLQVWSYGTVDEATSILGVIYATLEFDELKRIVRTIQQKMFIVGAQLASDEKGRAKLGENITESDIQWLEDIIDGYTRDFEKIKNFTIPGETVVSSMFHVARTVVRRAERHVVELSRTDEVDPLVLGYLNRLSDALYILAKMEVFQSFVRKVANKVYQAAGGGNPSEVYRKEYIIQEDLLDILANAAYEESRNVGIDICFSIVDKSGILLYFKRFGNALLVSVGISQNKAYTSAVMKMDTGALSLIAQPGQSLYGINESDPHLVIFGGGYPLHVNGTLVGAIGVSGGSVEQDEQIGKKVLEAFNNYVEKQSGSCC